MAQVVFSFPTEILLIVIPRTLEVGLTTAYPFLVQEAISFLDTPSASVNVGYGLLGGFFCVSMGIAVSQQPAYRNHCLLTVWMGSWLPLGAII